MLQIQATLDFETSPASKQQGRFYVVELIDEKGKDLTHLVKGLLFNSIGQLRTAIKLSKESSITIVNTPVSAEAEK